jgi:hypothetical protein
MDGWNYKPTNWENISPIYNSNDLIISEFDSEINYNEIDGIFVLAGGIDKEGKCHNFVKERLNLAWQIHKLNNKPIFCLGGGSYHMSPILNESGFIIHEATSCSEYLISLGVNSNMIYKEWSSYDTIANGFFAFTNFIIPLKLKNIILITSEFHIERSKLIFEWQKQIFNKDINIFYKSSNNNLNKDVLESRLKREKSSITNLKNTIIPKINTLELFHKWFYTEHKAYCSDSELNRKYDLKDELIKKSY